MCRFVAYLGKPILLDQLLYEPKNSLINQSFAAQEREEPLNGDGFGVGWYVPEIDPDPGVFVSAAPAWSNRNLRHVAAKTRSHCLMAHVRAASAGDVSEANCHPFARGRYLMMHNGDIGGFKQIKRILRSGLSNESYDWIGGQTDSEHMFALFMDHPLMQEGETTLMMLKEALEATVRRLGQMKTEVGVKEPTYLNVAIADGHRLLALRYVSDRGYSAESLYYSEGTRYECDNSVARLCRVDRSESSVMVVSERLTDVPEDWFEIPVNHFLMVERDLTVTLTPVHD